MKDINFSNIPLLAGLDRVNLARLIPSFEQVELKSGEIVFRQGEPGDALFIIIHGTVRVFLEQGGQSHEIACLGPGECFGEMALLTGEPRSADVQAMTDLVLLKLFRDRFDQLIKKHPSLGVNFAGLLASRLQQTNAFIRGQGETLPALAFDRMATAQSPVTVEGRRPSLLLLSLKDKRIFALLLVIVICTLSALLLEWTSLSTAHILLIELLLAATILWSMNAFSFHTVSIALPVFTVLLRITTPERAFSGFSSPTWFLVLGVFAISAAISKTGLLYRFALLMMKRFPQSYFGQVFGLAFSGLILTPVIPSPNGRVILASPLVLTLCEILGFKKGSAGAVGISMACLLGYGHSSILFMNGSATCFFVLGLLPAGVSSSVTWGYWLKAALLMGLFFFFCSYLAIVLLYRPREMRKLSPFIIDVQLKTLGPLTTHEKISLITVIVSLAGFMTQSWHHINGAWVAMLSFLVLLAGSVLDEKTVRSDIDWNFLISFGALVGFGSIISTSGLTEVIAREAKPYLEFFVGSTWIFLLMVTICSTLIRFILPFAPALLVCILALLPISSTLEINPLVIGLVVLMCNDPWFLPHQDIMFQNLLMNTEGKLFTHGKTVKLAFFHVLIIMAAVLISIPYWQYLGLIP